MTIKLYIDNRLADIDDDFVLAMNYQIADLSNPTVIKNSFSLSAKLKGTKTNNAIFGDIYRLDRLQNIKSFNPIKRTNFKIFKNNELFQEGYLQLTDITIKNDAITYQVSFYGGLGDFFYNLSNNEETGEVKTLADLRYNVRDDIGNILPFDDEFNFTINKDFVNSSWENINNDKGDIYSFISFAPTYIGKYDNFANDKLLVNALPSNKFCANPKIVKTVDGASTTYSTYNGYCMLNLDRDLTQWEVRDLRSYMQKPVIKFKKVLSAICDPQNNGGYNVKLDYNFFNSRNPYYDKSYIALPLLTKLNDDVEVEADVRTNTKTEPSPLYVGYDGTTIQAAFNYYGKSIGCIDIDTITDNNYTLDISKIPVTDNIYLDYNFQLKFKANTSLFKPNIDYSKAYISAYADINGGTLLYRQRTVLNAITVQAVVFDAATNKKIAESDMLSFTNYIQDINGNTRLCEPSNWATFKPNEETQVNTILGRFERVGNTDEYIFRSDNLVDTFQIKVANIPNINKIKIRLDVRRVSSQDKLYPDNDYPRNLEYNALYPKTYCVWNDKLHPNTEMWMFGNITANEKDSISYLGYDNSNSSDIRSGSLITKKKLLSTSYTPADLLINYCKIFGLMFQKDQTSNTIHIYMRNTFFKNNIVDINRLCDTTEIKIKPTKIDSKYYLLKQKDSDTYFSKLYKKNYENRDYGQQRINTNYEFNNETKDLIPSNIYYSVIPALDKSGFFRTCYENQTAKEVPSFSTTDFTIDLYKDGGLTDITTDKLQPWYGVNPKSIVDFNKIAGFDIFPKVCYYEKSDGEKQTVDNDCALLLFNGFVDTKNVNGDNVNYIISDDLKIMNALNENELCYLYTESEYDKNNNHIAHIKTKLPVFSRYVISNNSINDSLDFGTPNELYLPNISYNVDKSLYDRYWKRYLNDQFDVDTKEIEISILPNIFENTNNINEMLRNFYYYDNSVWIISKINNYDITKDTKTIKCNLIKIKSISNYTEGQYQNVKPNIELSNDFLKVNNSSGNVEVIIYSSKEWEVTSTSTGLTLDKTKGNDGDVLKISYPENTNPSFKNYTVRIASNNSTAILTIEQSPNRDLTIVLKGLVLQNTVPIPDAVITIKKLDNTNYYRTVTNSSGVFNAFVPKNEDFNVDVYIPKLGFGKVFKVNAHHSDFNQVFQLV